MEYAKRTIFRMDYNERKDIVESEHKKGTSKLKEKILHNRLLATVIMAFVIFSTINIIMIYNFINILRTI